MEIADFEEVLQSGESATVEFKRCGGVPEHDTYETVCSFANHAGGAIYLGVEDDGTVRGIPKKSALSIERNIANVTSQPQSFSPTLVVETERFVYEGKTVIRIWVPPTSSVFRYKGQVWDRIADTDQRISGEMQISQMYIRKQNVYTEQRIYPGLALADLDLTLLDRIRHLSANKAPNHPWATMDDNALLHSTRLYSRDFGSKTEGLTLAAGLLLGKDETIADLVPAYYTDAVVRKENLDRYDDRLVVRTNLIDAADALMEFLKKSLPDKYYMENDRVVSPRDRIIRELVSNSLMHREYLSPVPAQITVTRRSIETRNASRPSFEGAVDLGNFTPISKNPTIANVFTQIGLAEELGSGVRNLVKYTKVYSGGIPRFEDGFVFTASVPTGPTAPSDAPKQTPKPEATQKSSAPMDADGDEVGTIIERLLSTQSYVTAAQVSDGADISVRTARRRLSEQVKRGKLVAVGKTSGRKYVLP